MVPFVILLFVVVAFSSNEVESQCSKQEYQRCVSLAEPLLKDPHLIYPDNMKDIESVCRTWSVFVGCIKDYTERCFTEARREEFNKAIESPVSSIHKLCSSPEYRNDYLKHATCMKMTLTQDTMCGRHYKLLVSQVSGEAPPSAVCCSHHLLRECVVDHAKRSCDPESAPYASSMLDKALSFLREQCANYVPSQADCPGADFYMSTSPSMAASNTHYSADPTLTSIGTFSNPDRAGARSTMSKSSLPMSSPSTKPMSTIPSSPMTSASTSSDSKMSRSSYQPALPSSTRSEPEPWSAPASTAFMNTEKETIGSETWRFRTTSRPTSPIYTKVSSDYWIPSMRPPQMVDNSIDEPNQQGLDGSQRIDNSGNQLSSPVVLLTTALMLLACGPALTR